MNRLFIVSIAVMMLCIVPPIQALDCYVDNDPFITFTTAPSALCIPDDPVNNECITWLSNPADKDEIWGVMPEPSEVPGVGTITTFIAEKGSVVVEFSTDNLYDNFTATGNVQCGNEAFAFNFTAHFADYDEVGDAMVWTKTNIALLVFAGIIVFLVLSIFVIPVLKEIFRLAR